ncbi:MAG: M48 family metalloprotease [Solirubrobacterales bacterium]
MAILAAVLFAFLAGQLLGPGDPPVDYERADTSAWFEKAGPGGTDVAEKYRSRSRLITLFGMLSGVALLAFLAFYRGPPVAQLLKVASRKPLLGAAALGAMLAVALAIAGLPASLLSFDLGHEYGLITQDLAGWAGDRLLSLLFSIPLTALAACAGYAAWRRFGRHFWMAASAIAVLFACIWLWLWPVAVSPLFNRFEPLPPGPARTEVMRVADQSGVDVGEVFSVDASRRSAALNAYVHGIGGSKRVVIYDNAIRNLSGDEFTTLIAHELAHVESNDIYRGLAFAILVIPLAALAIQLGAASILRRNGDSGSSPAVVLPLALGLSVMLLLLAIPGNRLSRQIEITADYNAIELTGDPDSMVRLQRRIAESNLSDPAPPAVWQVLFSTHPPVLDRIGLALAIKDEE